MACSPCEYSFNIFLLVFYEHFVYAKILNHNFTERSLTKRQQDALDKVPLS